MKQSSVDLKLKTNAGAQETVAGSASWTARFLQSTIRDVVTGEIWAQLTGPGSWHEATSRASAFWRGLTLARQFAVVSAAVIFLGMLAIGLWVSDRISSNVIYRTATESAVYMDGFIAPLAQELATSNSLSPKAMHNFDELTKVLLGRRVVEVKIWHVNGTILYSNDRKIIGQKYPISDNFVSALRGSLAVEFDGDHHADDGLNLNHNGKLLEIYAPVRDSATQKVIAVLEFYTIENGLAEDLWRATILSWLFVGIVASSMVSALYLIVRSGSETIETQRIGLARQVAELEKILDQNLALRRRLQRGYRRSGEINEQILRRVSADLHDGPVQYVSLALLMLHSLDSDCSDARQQSDNLERMHKVLANGLQEMRDLSTGLILPELTDASMEDVIGLAIDAHVARTATSVAVEIDSLPEVAPPFVKACAYRFVQEALNNSFKHAGGAGQRVMASCVGGICELRVSDDGRGTAASARTSATPKLGLMGMRDRIEALGGEFRVEPGVSGWSVVATMDIQKAMELEQDHGAEGAGRQNRDLVDQVI